LRTQVFGHPLQRSLPPASFHQDRTAPGSERSLRVFLGIAYHV
jgi:hypothetical protein